MHWVIFDYGEVLCTRTEVLPELAHRLGVPEPEFETAYWRHRDAYDRGSSDGTYWRAIAETLGVAIDAATVADLTRLDIAGWSRLHPASAALLDSLAAEGTALALLSNAPASFARFAERQPWARHFSTRVFSADVGHAKPDRAIYDHVIDRLAASPEHCVFFDDRDENITAARAVGLRAHLWRGADHAREVLSGR